MIENESFLKIIGFANRAHKLTLGATATSVALQKRQLVLIIIAEDLSRNAFSKIQSGLEHNRIPVITLGTKRDWGHFFGRSELGIVGIKDANFSKSLQKMLG